MVASSHREVVWACLLLNNNNKERRRP